MKPQKRKKRAPVRRSHLSPYYQKIWDACPDRNFRNKVMPLISFYNLVAPTLDDVTTEHNLALEADLASRGYANARSWINGGIQRLAKIRAIGLDIPEVRQLDNVKILYERERAGFPSAVWKPLEQFVAAQSSWSDQTKANNLDKLHLALALHLAARRTVGCPADLVTKDAIKFVSEHPNFGGLDSVNHTRRSLLRLLGSLSGHLGDKVAKARAAKATKAVINGKWRREVELPLDLLLRLCAFDSLTEFDRVIAGYVAIIVDLKSRADLRGALPDAQDSLGAILVLSTCVSRQDLLKAAFAGESRKMETGERPALVIPGRPNFENTLDESTRLIIDLYYRLVLLRAGKAPQVLFEGFRGVRDESTVGKNIAKLTAKLGHRFSISELRVLAIFWLRKAKPKTSVESLAGLAGFKTTESFRTRYRVILAYDASVRFGDQLKLEESK